MTLMWSMLGILFVLALWGMNILLDARQAAFAVWQWAVYVAWLLWTLLGVALVRTFVDEREPHAVKVSLLVFGTVSVLGAVILAMILT